MSSDEVRLHGRNFLTLLDFSRKEVQFFIDLAAWLKLVKKQGREPKCLAGKNFALIFEKGSTRTRCSFEVACADQGAMTTYLGAGGGTHFGSKETVDDSARVLGRMYDALVYRGHGQKVVNQLVTGSKKCVINALTEEFHPTQGLADLLTLREHNPGKKWSDLKFVYVGDAQNNVSNTFIIACCKVGVNVGILAPKELQPEQWLVDKVRSEEIGGNLIIGDHTQKAEVMADADGVYTDVWVSMGEPAEVYKQRLELLKYYQVNESLMELTKKKDGKRAFFYHCLPANQSMTETETGRAILKDFGEEYNELFSGTFNGNKPSIDNMEEKGMEVTNDVFEGPGSVVFDQAENRLHTIKAICVALMAEDEGALAYVPGGMPEVRSKMNTAGFTDYQSIPQSAVIPHVEESHIQNIC